MFHFPTKLLQNIYLFILKIQMWAANFTLLHTAGTCQIYQCVKNSYLTDRIMNPWAMVKEIEKNDDYNKEVWT